jgi:hypothetical protein
MTPLAFVLATPIFGFALTPPDLAPPAGLFQLPFFAQVADAGTSAEETEEQATETSDAEEQEEEAAPEQHAPAQPRARESSDHAQLGAQIRARDEIAAIHRAFGIATWGSMLVTVVLGLIQYNNLYGWFGSLEDTPCVRGHAVFGQEQCWGFPYPHAIAASLTGALYATTFILSFVMPDPLDADQGNSQHAQNLRIHETLRWFHLGGMLAQIVLGAIVGLAPGLDRANDFGALQALATVHEVIGLATFGVLTAAGALMLF